MEISDTVVAKTSRLKSLVWNDFDRVKKGDTCVAICRHCKKKLSGSSTSGTSHLRNHLIRCRRRSNQDISQYITRGKKKEGPLPITTFCPDQEQNHEVNLVNMQCEQGQSKSGIVNISNYNFDQRRSQFDLARMIILHGYPLDMVEHVGFRIFVKNLQPLFELLSFNSVEADCKLIYEKEKQKVWDVLNKVPGKLSIAADMWVGSRDAEYLCLTAHYIDEDWQLKKKIMNLILVDSSHTVDNLSEVVRLCIQDWGIFPKLLSMTFDSCSSNESVVLRISKQLDENGVGLLNSQFDLRCAVDVIKLMVQDALEALCDVTLKIRESIRYVRSSQAMQDKFSEIVEQLGVTSQKCLSIDNPLCWNLTYFMLEAALEFRRAFSHLSEIDPVYSTICPSDSDWDIASEINSYLALFVEAVSFFIEEKYPTANIYFRKMCEIHVQLIEACKSSDEYTSKLALAMKSRYEEYWNKCSLTLALAAILDPRYKMKLVEYYYPFIYDDDAQNQIEYVSESIRALHGEPNTCSLSGEGVDWHVSCSGEGTDPGCLPDARDRLTGFDKFLHDTSQTQSVKSDLDKYLEEPLFPLHGDFNILNWWKVNTPKYPIVSMMARNVLGIPMSKISPELAFNVGGKVVDNCWSSLNPDTVQALICARDWMLDEQEDAKLASSYSNFSSICYDAN